MLALAASSPVATLAAGRYLANRRGHGGHRVRGPHAPPAAPSFIMGQLPRRGARAMDETDTPPDPRGVPYQVARVTLTEPELIREYRVAQNAELPVPDLHMRMLLFQQETTWGAQFSRDVLGPRCPSISKVDQDALRKWEAIEGARRERISRADEALDADFRRLVRAGRIIASAFDPNSPFEPPRDLHPHLAADLQSPDFEPRIHGGPVLPGLRYRRATDAPLVLAAPAPALTSAKASRQGPRDPARDAPVLELARPKIAAGTKRQTAVKQAHKEVYREYAEEKDVKRYLRALGDKKGDTDK